jgi:thioredoxin-related protein
MKRLICFFLLIPFLSISQISNEINWLPLDKAKEYAAKSNKNILIYFYKKDCSYCSEMSKNTLSDKEIISLVNNNFFAVKIDSRTKDTIYYQGKAYGNQQPASSGRNDWRHDFYAEVASFNHNGTKQSTTPTIVVFNHKFEKLKTFPGKQAKSLLFRRLLKYAKK